MNNEQLAQISSQSILHQSIQIEPAPPPPPRQILQDQQILAIIICTIIALAAQTLFIYLFIVSCSELFTTHYPLFSLGFGPKAIIAVGFYAEGIVAVGIIGQGLITISMGGIGMLFFIGQIGGGLGYGIYQLGTCWYCQLAQVSIGIWQTKKAQLGVSLLAPLCYPEKKHIINDE